MNFDKASLSSDSTTLQRASWAVVLGLLTACAGCSNGTDVECKTDELPATDPCFMKGCCDTIYIDADGGVIENPGEDAGAGTTSKICGACNG